MTQDKPKPQEQDADTINQDPSLYQEAINESVDQYEKSANSDELTQLNNPTQKELGEVERALEDSVMGIEDAS
jgi:PleD family two-component response regulator